MSIAVASLLHSKVHRSLESMIVVNSNHHSATEREIKRDGREYALKMEEMKNLKVSVKD